MPPRLVLFDSPLPPTATCEFVSLWHPTCASRGPADKPSAYAVVHAGNNNSPPKLLEGIRMQEPERKSGSWFVNDHVLGDGSVVMFVQADVKLLLLPELDQCRSMWIPMEQIFKDRSRVNVAALESCLTANDWNVMCDMRTDVGVTFVKLNETKTLQWLNNKVTRTKAFLESNMNESSNHDTGGAMADAAGFCTSRVSSFVIVQNNDVNNCTTLPSAESQDALIWSKEMERRAAQIVCDSLCERWRILLCESRGFTIKQVLAATPIPHPTMASMPPPPLPKTWEENNGFAVPASSVLYKNGDYNNNQNSSNSGGSGSTSTGSGSSSNGSNNNTGGEIAKKAKLIAAPPQPKTVAAKKLAKVDTRGMKSIHTFFQKKSSE